MGYLDLLSLYCLHRLSVSFILDSLSVFSFQPKYLQPFNLLSHCRSTLWPPLLLFHFIYCSRPQRHYRDLGCSIGSSHTVPDSPFFHHRYAKSLQDDFQSRAQENQQPGLPLLAILPWHWLMAFSREEQWEKKSNCAKLLSVRIYWPRMWPSSDVKCGFSWRCCTSVFRVSLSQEA